MYQQRRLTKCTRRIKQLSNFKEKYPKISKVLHINKIIKTNKDKQREQVKHRKEKRYNIYLNKSKVGYFADRIADIIELRTGISKKLFNKETQAAIEQIRKDGINLNSQQLKDLSDKFKLHELGNVEISTFTKDYCVHEISFKSFLNMQDDLEVADIPYAVKTIYNDDNTQTVEIYFENKHLERYSELGFNNIGQIHVYGNNNKNLQWDIKSQDELVSFTTKTGTQELQTYQILSGKNYIMKREENNCVWTVLKDDLKDLAEKEKKRDVVNEDLENLHIFEELEKDANTSPIISENLKEINVDFDNEIEKAGE